MSDLVPYARRSARVLLLDGTGRVLLLRYCLDPAGAGGAHTWFTPGGGVHGGETLPQAAARELREEIGLTVSARDLGQPVAYSTGYADLGYARGLFRDHFFCHRVDLHDVDTSSMEALEHSYHVGHRWWSVDELRSTAETIYPHLLAPLLTALLAGRIPAEPVRLPWHH